MRRPPPTPQAIDPASGFKVPLSDLVRQWDNELIDRRFVDKRNPQDFVRGVKDNMALPYNRPEASDVFVAVPLESEDGGYLLTESGLPIYGEGIVPGDTL